MERSPRSEGEPSPEEPLAHIEARFLRRLADISAEMPQWKHAEAKQLQQRDEHEFEGALQLDSDTMQSLIHAVEGLIRNDDDTEEALKNALHHIALRLGYPDVWRQKDETLIRQEVDDQGILRSTSVPSKTPTSHESTHVPLDPDDEEWFKQHGLKMPEDDVDAP